MFMSNQKQREHTIVMMTALCSVAEINAITLIISFLARLHNILIDQPQMELFAQNVHLWPAVIKK